MSGSTCAVGTDGVFSLGDNEGHDLRAVCSTDFTAVDCTACVVDMCLSNSVAFANRRPHFIQSAASAAEGEMIESNLKEISMNSFNYNPSMGRGSGTFAELHKPLETWRNFAKVPEPMEEERLDRQISRF